MVSILDDAAHDAALKLARGSYQRAILTGWARLSGADLRGKARKWSGGYARSRDAIVARVRAAGIPITEARGAHGLRYLVIG